MRGVMPEFRPGLPSTVGHPRSRGRLPGVRLQCWRNRAVACFRGSQSDVAGRFLGILEEYPMEAFVRVSADSPMLDQRLVGRGVEMFALRHLQFIDAGAG